MSDPVGEVHPQFSDPAATARPWSEIVEVLDGAEIFWLSTTRGDGRPHVTPIPSVWHDGRLHIATGAAEQKAKNLARDPRCILTTGTPTLNAGLDLVVEGTVERVTDQATLQQLATMWKDQLDWDFEVTDDGFADHGSRNAIVYAVNAQKLLAFGKGDPFSQTRYRFA